MRICPYCGHQNEDDILICSLCKRSLRRHKYRWIRWSVIGGMIILLMATVYTIEYFSSKAELAQKSNAKLEILASAGYRTRDFKMRTEGKVRNISGQNLHNIYAVVSWYSKDNKLLGKEKNLINTETLPNFRTSSFVVKIPYKKGMENYDISFETEGGIVLYSVDKSGKQQLPSP